MSLFITFEGCDGCGKSTQSLALKRRLQKIARTVMLLHEPGGTRLGNRISYLLKWTKNVSISPTAELLLFNASRANLVDEVIVPALHAGRIVICDRFADSTIAYQGYGRSLDITFVKSTCAVATRGLRPDLTILLDVPVQEGLKRKAGTGNNDRFEQTDLAFHQRVRQGYLAMAQEEPGRWFVVDATQPRERTREIIWQKVSSLLGI